MDVVGKFLDFLSAFVKPTVFALGLVSLGVAITPGLLASSGLSRFGVSTGNAAVVAVFCVLFLAYEPLSKWVNRTLEKSSKNRETQKVRREMLRLSRRAQTIIHLMLRENMESIPYDSAQSELVELEAAGFLRPVQALGSGRYYAASSKLDDVKRGDYGWAVSGLNVDPAAVPDIVSIMNGHSGRV
jgi:hypothetical protein